MLLRWWDATMFCRVESRSLTVISCYVCYDADGVLHFVGPNGKDQFHTRELSARRLHRHIKEVVPNVETSKSSHRDSQSRPSGERCTRSCTLTHIVQLRMRNVINLIRLTFLLVYDNFISTHNVNMFTEKWLFFIYRFQFQEFDQISNPQRDFIQCKVRSALAI